MGREVRRVPADWQHPRDKDGCYLPLYDEDYDTAARKWLDECMLWDRGEHPDQSAEWAKDLAQKYQFYWDWGSSPPDKDYYRPAWPEQSRTHLQMYENTSEGTPISPVMETAEELAHWLADNNVSAFANMTATYEQWLATIKRGSVISAVGVPGQGLVSGVEAFAKLEDTGQ